MAILKVLWLLVHAVLALPVVMVTLQIFVARRTPPLATPDMAADAQRKHATRASVAVLVPAHNERAGIAATLQSIKPQMREGDRLIVVADNCSDDTAAIARSFGAEVLERVHLTQRGKGYALDHGVAHLKATTPPGMVLMCDADCHLAAGSLDRLVNTCMQTNQPVQALDLMKARPGADMQQRFAEFAWRVKNQVRPSGGARLGVPCALMGTGMIFPWSVIATAPLASGHLAEDVQLGVNLVLAGHFTRFEPRALVTSEFPQSTAGAQVQRSRWEHGALDNLVAFVPKLLVAGLVQRRMRLIGTALDLMVPPLALLLMLLGVLLIVNGIVAWTTGWWTPAIVSLAILVLFASGVVVAWVRFGQGTVTAGELLAAPWYAARKIPLYVAFLVKRQTQWVRAKRDDE